MLDETAAYATRPPERAWDDAALVTAARERAEFLARAGRQVSGSLNLANTVRRSLRVCVPTLADWAQLMLVIDSEVRYEAISADDPDELRATVGVTDGQRRILATARPELLHVVDGGPEPDGLTALVPPGPIQRQVAGLRPADLIGVPLTARGVTFGTLTLARRAGHGFAPEDITLVEDLAGRIALALDAARRYAERSGLAATLQESLRPPTLPVLAGVQLAARYRPATEDAELGGDFYDVWGSDDEWSLVLGDVAGKGVAAAVVTGQARHTVRGAAYVDRRPAPVLRALNALLADIGAARFVTAVYAHVRPDPAGGLLITASSAGHPAPLIIRADGTVTRLDVRGVAAGVLPSAEYVETQARLAPGDTLLCYTDGVTESGRRSARDNTDRLTALARQYAGASVNALVEAIEMDVVERSQGARRDDMAVLAVRAAG